jgi:hypothetical protein
VRAIEILCSCHGSATRLVARALESLDSLGPEAAAHALDRAADLAGEDTMIVVVRDPDGRIRWQLLPRAA